MKTFVEYIKSKGIIHKLVDFYTQNENLSLPRDELTQVVEEILDKLISQDNQHKYKAGADIFGLTYQSLTKHEDKKQLGEFYTPIEVVDHILDGIGYNPQKKIEILKVIDISCGSGSFLLKAVQVLVKRLRQKKEKNSRKYITREDAKHIIQKVQDNIQGIDINPVACMLCQLNFHLALFELYELIRAQEKDFEMPIFSIRNMNSLELGSGESHDLVIGNPPYLFIRDIPEPQKQIIKSRQFETSTGQYDYYQIFIELGINLLKNGGRLGYIVPDSMLALSNRAVIREFIKNNCQIKEIFHIGPKFIDPVVSNIIIILKKEINEKDRNLNQMLIRNSIHEEVKYFRQSSLKHWDFKFLVNLDKIDIEIMDEIKENSVTLGELFENPDSDFILSRGVELGKTGEIVKCSNCHQYAPLPRRKKPCSRCGGILDVQAKENIIIGEAPKEAKGNFMPFINSMERYKITEWKYIDISKKGINYKEENIYLDNIIIRQISQNNLICATYYEKLSYVSQSYYNLRILKTPHAEFNAHYLLGLINSQIMSYHFIKSFGSYKKLFPRILIEKIKKLPVIIPDTLEKRQLARELAKNVKKMLKNPDDNLQRTIDELAYRLFKLSGSFKQHVAKVIENLE